MHTYTKDGDVCVYDPLFHPTLEHGSHSSVFGEVISIFNHTLPPTSTAIYMLINCVSLSQLLPESLSKRSLMLSNGTLTPLTFRLKVKSPFALVDLGTPGSDNKSRVLETDYHTLRPAHNIMVHLFYFSDVCKAEPSS